MSTASGFRQRGLTNYANRVLRLMQDRNLTISQAEEYLDTVFSEDEIDMIHRISQGELFPWPESELAERK